MDRFVTDTLMVDIRDGNTFFQPGDAIPREAMDPRTLKTLGDRGEILPYTDMNKYQLNPGLILREQVANLARQAGQKVSAPPPKANSVADLERMERGLEPVDGPQIPPTVTQVTVPETKTTKQVENVWNFNSEALKALEYPVLLSMMSERAKAYEQRVPESGEFANKDDLIRFMSSEFLTSVPMLTAPQPQPLVQKVSQEHKQTVSGPTPLIQNPTGSII